MVSCTTLLFNMNNVWGKLCRACLTTKESFTYFILENVSAETYLFCTSIQVKEDEGLPNALCDGCYELLSSYSKFKHTCIESQNTLLLCTDTVKTENVLLTRRLDEKEVEISEENKDELENYSQTKTELDIKQEELSDDHVEEDTTLDASDDSMKNMHPLNINHSRNIVQHKRRKKLKKLKSKNGICATKEPKHQLHSCEVCQKKFTYRKRFEAHKLEHNGQRDENLQCVSCSKTFMTLSGLKRHVESSHTSVRLSSVACKRCGRVCASKHSLRAHEKMHGKTRTQVVCHVCGKRVASTVILKTHLETHKAERERRHTCEHCGKKFFTNTILLSHIKRLHTGLRYICGICDYPFTDKYNLAKHLLVHDGKKLYKCDICDKSYARNGSLIEHKRIHSGERPFNCSFCPKSFLSKRRLMDHHRIHTGDKPHRCMVCEQRFTQRGTLKRHMKVHDPMKAPTILT